jgi:hypothetical protein
MEAGRGTGRFCVQTSIFVPMSYGKLIRLSLLLALVVMATGIFIVSGWHSWIEQHYSTGFYPPLAAALRSGLGFLPFSLGDLLYSVALLYILYELFLFFRRLLNRKSGWKEKLIPLQKAIIALLALYVYFYLFWGLNYYRLGIEHQLNINNQQVQTSELKELTTLLLQRVNQTKEICLQRQDTVMDRQRMFRAAEQGYQQLEPKFSFLKYRNLSVKPSLFGKLGNYVGFEGYYNPFTGEGQVNVQIPNFIQPFVTCHEMAHQLGYASESEANFVGFLAAAHSTDTLLQYSAYFDMFLYSVNNLRRTDSTAARQLVEQLHEGARRDLRTYRRFLQEHRSYLSELTDSLYDYYLKQNRQQKGIESYHEVTGWLIAYHQKYGLP